MNGSSATPTLTQPNTILHSPSCDPYMFGTPQRTRTSHWEGEPIEGVIWETLPYSGSEMEINERDIVVARLIENTRGDRYFICMKLNPLNVSNLFLLLILCACATARVVKVQPGQGGVVAVMPAQNAEARQKAEDLMSANCQGQGFDIIEEGEAVVGQSLNASTYKSPYGHSSSTSGTNRDQTEWRLTSNML
jgi:hypothetical protein